MKNKKNNCLFYSEMAILYTGVGSINGGIHTEEEFIQIMNDVFVDILWTDERKNNCREQLEYENFILPEQFSLFTLDDWIDYAGAERV
jgi:hypothetical protein